MESKKVGILTLPLHTNYGGILQNYALQQVLKKQGHKVVTINNDYIVKLPLVRKYLPALYSQKGCGCFPRYCTK